MVTKGERGCTAYVDGHKQVRSFTLPAEGIADAVDSTGCGDVFAAAYCVHYARTREIDDAVKFANRVAGRKAAMSGSADIDSLAAFRHIPAGRV